MNDQSSNNENTLKQIDMEYAYWINYECKRIMVSYEKIVFVN
jgi:hypothetical protein